MPSYYLKNKKLLIGFDPKLFTKNTIKNFLNVIIVHLNPYPII